MPNLPPVLDHVIERLVSTERGLEETVRRRTKRRHWVGDGRAHIEVRGGRDPDNAGFFRALELTLRELRGVNAADLNGILGRVVVAFDADEVSPADLLDVVATVEEAHGHHTDTFPTELPDHPGDIEPLRRQLLAVGADVVGAGAATLRRLIGLGALPPEVAPLLSLVESTPRLRGQLERHLGPAAVDLLLAVTSAGAQALSQGPFGLLVDAARRTGLAAEAASARRAWQRREPELHGAHRDNGAPAIDGDERPCPLPPGPLERYADVAGLASLAGSAAALLLSRSHDRAATVLADVSPKAAAASREAFAAWLGVSLCGRDVIPLDSRALRRLDRLDTIVLQADALMVGDFEIVHATGPGGEALRPARARDVLARARMLFDSGAPTAQRAANGWTLRAATPGRRRGRREIHLELAYHGRPVAVLTASPGPHALAGDVIAAAKEVGHVVLAGEAGLTRRLGLTEALPGGPSLAAHIRRMQREGRVIGLVAARGDAALRAADCGLGVVGDHGRVPWGAHLLCGSLESVVRVLDAAPAARQVSRRGDVIAAWGSGVGALFAAAGPGRHATTRALYAVNAATAAAVALGTWTSVELARRPDPVHPDGRAWHAMDAETVLSALDTSRRGLGTDQARDRRQQRPAVRLDDDVTVARAVGQELVNPLTPVLAAGATVAAASGAVGDALLISAVVAANAVLGGVQRVGASRALRRLFRAASIQARVRRDGQQCLVPADDVVPGDVVELEAGETVVGDCRILTADDVEVDESTLTGESQLVDKQAEPVRAAGVAERSSMLYDGSVLAAGQASGVVVGTGLATEARRGLATPVSAPVGGPADRLRSLTRATVPAAIGAGSALVLSSLAHGRSLRDAMGAGVALAVAAIPEGLPLVTTVAELAAARRLARDGVVVRNPSTMEKLGRADVLCFDKTGTLTAGEVRLALISDGVAEWPVADPPPSARLILAAGLRASPAALAETTLPHPTDRAVIALAEACDVAAEHGCPGWRLVDEVPFESHRGYHAALGATHEGQMISVKGAPEVVLPLCVGWRHGAQRLSFDERARGQVEATIDQLTARGYRVLAVAERTASYRSDLDERRVANVDLIGLLAFADPLRPTSKAAIAELGAAGIRVLMATGDHPVTARRIGDEVGITGEVLTGADVDLMSDSELTTAVQAASIFARVSPNHKVRLVRALQAAGYTVAMTGDGANDAPAIRLADVGVALGDRRTDAARDAADLVVVDYGIEAVIGAIVAGRRTWASVRDAVSVLVGGNLGEIAFTLGSGLVSRQGSPLNARQMLLVNLFTDVLPSMALAVGAGQAAQPEQLFREGPDASLGHALTRDVVTRAGVTAAAAGGAWLFAGATGTRGRASTIALSTLVATQLGQTVATGWRSPLVIAATGVSAAGLVVAVQTPGLSQFFGCRPIGPVGWATVLTASGLGTAGSVIAGPLADRFRSRRPR